MIHFKSCLWFLLLLLVQIWGVKMRYKGCRYEGEVKRRFKIFSSVPHGKGRIYCDNYAYDGDWVNGEQTGFGVVSYSSGARYIGELLNGFRHGQGKFIFSNHDVYSGSWVKNKQSGNGIMSWSHSMYVGEFFNSRLHGEGMLFINNGPIFLGTWVKSRRTGSFIKFMRDGAQYKGQYFNNFKHGPGVAVSPDNRDEKQFWRNGKRLLVPPNEDHCSICLQGYSDEKRPIMIRKCLHEFHSECFTEWFGRNPSCPLCRENILLHGARAEEATFRLEDQ